MKIAPQTKKLLLEIPKVLNGLSDATEDLTNDLRQLALKLQAHIDTLEEENLTGTSQLN